MKISHSSNLTRRLSKFVFTAVILLGMSSCSRLCCTYLKMNPPPDADKTVLANNNSCYLATAANMLAGAGYGTGNTVQARADDIYGQLVAQFGTANGGWTDAAVSWWLGSANNTWPNNPYTVVTVYGNKSPKYPWANADGAKFIGNELRRCQFVGLSISWPTNAHDPAGNDIIGSGGHAVTCWGDNVCADSLTANPSKVKITDSDNDTGGDVQTYDYDSYTNPNPGGANEGNGWYFDYDNNHPYIKHIVTLCPTQLPSGNQAAQRVTGTFRIHQAQSDSATDLHYRVGTDVDILSYSTKTSWSSTATPTITENQPRRSLTVDWDFTRDPIPYCKWITITTEFILPYWNAISYDSVHFTYPKGITGRHFPPLKWVMQSPVKEKAASIPNVTGGYVIGAFDVIDPSLPSDQQTVMTYRFIHQYSFNQDPESHTLLLTSEKGFAATNFRFGHSYGYVSADSLWTFDKWMTESGSKTYAFEGKPVELKIDWKGRLPYPQGEDIKGRIKDLKNGLEGTMKEQ